RRRDDASVLGDVVGVRVRDDAAFALTLGVEPQVEFRQVQALSIFDPQQNFTPLPPLGAASCVAACRAPPARLFSGAVAMIISAYGGKRGRESRRLLRAEVFYAAALAAFAVLAVLAHAYAYFAWDLSLARAIQSNDS